jgi:HEAT repeat protein
MLRTWRCRNNTSPTVLVAAVLLGLCLGTHSDAQSHRDRSVREWIELLKSEDVRQRWYATLALARIGPDAGDAISPLMSLLAERSQYEYVRAGAALALGCIHDDPQRVVPLLAETLESELASVRRHSARALGRFGPRAEPAVPRMLSQLRRDDPIFRIDLAEALWQVAKHERAVPFLIEQVQTGNTPGGFEAAEALGRVWGEIADLAVPALVEALGSSNADISRSAARSLARMGSTVLPRLAGAASSERVSVRRSAIEAYAWMGPAGASGLVGALNDPAPVVRRAAARGLGRLGPQVAAVEPALLRAVNDTDPNVRATAAAALKQIGRVLP